MHFFILLLVFFSTLCSSATLNESLLVANLKNSNFGHNEVEFFKKIDLKNRSHLLVKFRVNNFFFDIDSELSVKKSEAESILKSQIAIIEILYNDSPSPYAGVISNIEKCPKNLKPELKKILLNDLDIQLIKSFAGNKYESGICQKKKIKHLQCSAYFLKDTIFHKIKLFGPLNSNCEEYLLEYIKGLSSIK